jgi:hypothetical protein
MLGERLLEACRDKIERFYQLTDNGSLEPIALMFRYAEKYGIPNIGAFFIFFYVRYTIFAGHHTAGLQLSQEGQEE